MRLELLQDSIHRPIKADARTTMFLAPQRFRQPRFLQLALLPIFALPVFEKEVVVRVSEVGVDDDDVGGDFRLGLGVFVVGASEVDPIGTLTGRIGGYV